MSSAYIRHLLAATWYHKCNGFCSTGTCMIGFCNCLTKLGACPSHPQRAFRRVPTTIGIQLLEQCNQTKCLGDAR